MKKIFVFLILILFAIISFTIFRAIPHSEWSQACINSNCFLVELAKTNAEREKGLMHRSQLGQYSGMLFIFDKEGIYPFWMKNTLIPLDIIWIDGNPSADSGQVVFINKNSQPCPSNGECPSINPGVNATYVLEINAGFCDGLDIKVGDVVVFGKGG